MKVSALRLTLPSVIIALATTAVTLLGLSDAAVPILYAAPPLQTPDATLRIVNDSEQTICYAFLSPVTASNWGDDWLGGATIPPGETYSFDLPEGDYDVLLADCEGNRLLDERDVTISELYELRFTGPDLCEASIHEGTAFYQQARYDDALQKLQDALACYRETDDRKGEGAALNKIGLVYQYLDQYEQALAYYEEALTIRQEIGDLAGEGTTLNNIGGVYDSLGQYEQALAYYEEALTIWQEIGDRAGEGTTLNNIGEVHRHLGQYEQALAYFEEALTILREIGYRVREGYTLTNIGAVYQDLGQYEQAVAYCEEALTILREIGDRAGEGATLNNIGAVYQDLGKYEQALAYYEQALTIRREIGDQAGEGGTLNNIGLAYDNLGQYEQALAHYEEALTIWREIGHQAGEGATLSNIGVVYDSLEQYEQALAYYQEALTIQREIGDQAGEGVTLSNVGLAYWHLGQYEQALAYYEEALTIQREIGDQAGEGTTLNNIGLVYDSLGHYEQARDHFERAIAIFETVRAEMTVEEFKGGFAAENMRPYQWIMLLLMEMNRPAEAFHYVQRAKARTFLDQLANVHIAPHATDNTDLLAREQKLLSQIHALEAVLAGRSDISSLDVNTRDRPPPLTDEQRIEIQSRLQAAYREYEQLLTQIKLTNPQYAGLRSVQASTLITVQQTLPPDVALLEYYVAPTQTLAFVVTQGDFYAVPISVTAKALNDSIAWFRQFSSLEGVPEASQELYGLLFGPIREYLQTHTLYVAPHSVLHYLPFGALHDGENYLVEDYTIGYIPSASLFQYVNTETQGSGDAEEALVMGNPTREGVTPLPFAEQESWAVADLFGVPAYIGEAATESVVWEAAPRARYVHLAAHGSFNPVAPQFSRLYLAPDEAHDGYLELHEVWNLQLDRADLVTLSACETQLGELSAGDEVVGLSRAFIYAGTPSLVASLWSVEDESTAYLMEHFYGYLRDGMSKGEALRQAQLDTMAEYPSPYHWAPFTLIGDMGGVEVTAESDRPWFWVGGTVLFLVVVGGGVWMWSRRK